MGMNLNILPGLKVRSMKLASLGCRTTSIRPTPPPMVFIELIRFSILSWDYSRVFQTIVGRVAPQALPAVLPGRTRHPATPHPDPLQVLLSKFDDVCTSLTSEMKRPFSLEKGF